MLCIRQAEAILEENISAETLVQYFENADISMVVRSVGGLSVIHGNVDIPNETSGDINRADSTHAASVEQISTLQNSRFSTKVPTKFELSNATRGLASALALLCGSEAVIVANSFSSGNQGIS